MVRGLTEGRKFGGKITAGVDDGSIIGTSTGPAVSMAGGHVTAQSEPQQPILS